MMVHRWRRIFTLLVFALGFCARSPAQDKPELPKRALDPIQLHQVAELQKQIEAKRDELLNNLFKEYDITASKRGIDEAVKKKLKALSGKESFTQDDADRQNRLIGALKELLTIRRLDPKRAEMVYTQQYEKLFGRAAWEKAKAQYASEAAYKGLLRLPPVKVETANQAYRTLAAREIKERELEKILRKEGDIKPGEDLIGWLDRQPAIKKIKVQLPEALRGEPAPEKKPPAPRKAAGKAAKK